MFTIRLFCNQGMSTSILVNKMKAAAASEGTQADIAAYPVDELEERIQGADVALLGPQVGYLKNRAKTVCGKAGVPMDVIPMRDYGMCNGEAVLKFAHHLAGK
ncbi:MAG: PTS sugar transporter subunit IIB [Eubacterium sp.]